MYCEINFSCNFSLHNHLSLWVRLGGRVLVHKWGQCQAVLSKAHILTCGVRSTIRMVQEYALFKFAF